MEEPDADTPAGVPALHRDRLQDALQRTLESLDLGPAEDALGMLLSLYALELDGAAATAARAHRVAQEVAKEHGSESALYEQVQALVAALSKRQALDRIGARFHAGLVEMLGTPRARGAGKIVGVGGKSREDAGTSSPLTVLRLASGGDE